MTPELDRSVITIDLDTSGTPSTLLHDLSCISDLGDEDNPESFALVLPTVASEPAIGHVRPSDSAAGHVRSPLNESSESVGDQLALPNVAANASGHPGSRQMHEQELRARTTRRQRRPASPDVVDLTGDVTFDREVRPDGSAVVESPDYPTSETSE